MLKHKTIILTFILSVFLGLNSCKKNENIELITSLSATTLEQISTIAAVIQSNPDVGQSILNGVPKNNEFSGLRNARILTEEMPAELKKALDEFNADPKKVLKSIAKENQGAEKIALLEALFTQKDADIIEKRTKVFVNITIPESAKKGIKFDVSNGSKNGRINCTGDCKLHVMAGAAIAMGVSSAIYAAATWFTWQIKAAMIVAAGVSAAILFGAGKELWDYVRNQANPGSHGVEWRDFWNTVLGSFAGGAISFGIIMVSPHPFVAVAVIAAGSIFVGWNTIQCCVFNQCPC